jgi:pSer/pThr/pTyr-binding forkhead associated (FHA) protein
MVDPRLNSVHLEAPRRQEYRRAREALLGARGHQTIAAEHAGEVGLSIAEPHTLVQEPNQVSPDLKFWLVDKDYVFPLKVGLNTIGRSPDNDVVLQDGYVSRRHCAILVHAGNSCEVHDTASKNGTYINGRKIAGPTHLNTGDEIRMCDRQLIFIAKDQTPESPYHAQTLVE